MCSVTYYVGTGCDCRKFHVTYRSVFVVSAELENKDDCRVSYKHYRLGVKVGSIIILEVYQKTTQPQLVRFDRKMTLYCTPPPHPPMGTKWKTSGVLPIDHNL